MGAAVTIDVGGVLASSFCGHPSGHGFREEPIPLIADGGESGCYPGFLRHVGTGQQGSRVLGGNGDVGSEALGVPMKHILRPIVTRYAHV